MRALVSAAAAAVVLLTAASCGGGGRPSGDVLVTAERLFDGTAFHEPGAVLVRGGEVVAVGGSLHADAPRTIALGDATILPGFVDLHAHLQAGMLHGGVTTVRNLGAPLPELRRVGREDGLRVLRAGPILSVAGGYPSTVFPPDLALNVRGPGDARSAVRMLARRGAAVIKISLNSDWGLWPMLSVAEVRAIVSEAHRRGLAVTAHAVGPDGVRRALAGGVDELAHMPCGALDDQIRTIVARQIPVVATLHVEQLAFGGCQAVALRLVALGGELLYGSDVGNRGIPLGIDVAELRLLEEAGLTPVEVLAAATSRAGAELGLAPLGTLAAGAPADVVVVRGDARRLGSALASPLLVVAGGRVVAGPPTGQKSTDR